MSLWLAGGGLIYPVELDSEELAPRPGDRRLDANHGLPEHILQVVVCRSAWDDYLSAGRG